MARFDHVGAIGQPQRKDRHLIHQQYCHLFFAQCIERRKQLRDHFRRKTERGLVEGQDHRRRHEAAADGEHLLLAAREQSGALLDRFSLESPAKPSTTAIDET